MSAKVTALMAAAVFVVGFGGTSAGILLFRQRPADGLLLSDPVRQQTERLNDRLARGEKIPGVKFEPLSTRVDDKFEPIDSNKPHPTPPAEVEHALTHEGKSRVAEFDSKDHSHVLCRMSYVSDALNYQITEYTDARWDEENEASWRQWESSGCAKAIDGDSRLMDIYDATDLATDAMPDTPRYQTQKSIRKTMIAQARKDSLAQKQAFLRSRSQ